MKTYVVFEDKMKNYTSYFALTLEQLKDEASKVLFGENAKEIARVNTVSELKALNTEHKIMYMNNGKVRFA